MNQGLGLLNTLLMLMSSWLVASGVQAARRHETVLVRRFFKLAIGCGAAFLAVKYFEYDEKISAGQNMWANDFFMLYFCYTGIHMIHVILGMGVLAGLMVYAQGQRIAPSNLRNLEVGATFWHMVDLLWIVIFALFYLVGLS
ncbi:MULTISPECIES: cytochrome c oxidase subunit 3 [Pseudomonas]|uniref:cytochrome c oxidase subunit 3 n=1 Tax=Pseudomonas TaxID=286 RepID=UPI00273E4488|nr:cytochrome c oxidase subunit 3 [Pseudomonas aeruginosa]